MSHLVTAEELERIAWEHPCSTIQSEYDGDLEIRRHLTVGRVHYLANIARREVSLAQVKRVIRP